ncbi:MAG: hypothetical protein M5R42_03365 [Rhodocyclaceae bacterium]|nr:hypothetical protein [Rhodocyclaceae bacterium]
MFGSIAPIVEAGLAGQAAGLHAQEILDDALDFCRFLARMDERGETDGQEEQKSLQWECHG